MNKFSDAAMCFMNAESEGRGGERFAKEAKARDAAAWIDLQEYVCNSTIEFSVKRMLLVGLQWLWRH